MVSAVRYHEISESTHRIMNPFSLDKLVLLGDLCRLGTGSRLLDLACGKGEMLCRFAERFGSTGVGIDLHPPFLAEARARGVELGVDGSVSFLEGDAGHPAGLNGPFDVVSCIGATWIGGGLTGTLRLMSEWLAPNGWLLVGEVYWAAPPSQSVRETYEEGEGFADLGGTLERFEAAGLDLVEMVLASADDWDRYSASQWLNVADWLMANPDDPEAAEIRQDRDTSRRRYLSEERGCLGWGVFVLRRQQLP
ncbi:MAG: SAM-dependent methyltransferase [Acidimicrobiales bacterium]|jgi:SAM-dependent methyltransferase